MQASNKLATRHAARPRPLHRDPPSAQHQRTRHVSRAQRLAIGQMLVAFADSITRSASNTSSTHARPAPITVSYRASRIRPGKRSHSCPAPAAFLPSLPLALLFMAASSSYPARSSDRATNAATQISTTVRTSPTGRRFFCLTHYPPPELRWELPGYERKP